MGLGTLQQKAKEPNMLTNNVKIVKIFGGMKIIDYLCK